MPGDVPHDLLRAGLLDGVSVTVAEPARPELAAALTGLGAALTTGAVDALVVDAAARPGDVVDVMAGVWDHVRDTVNAAWIEPGRPGGKVVLVAPPADEPLRAALENLARTTSIEWARFGIRTTAIRPGERTTTDEIAALVAYLLSPAGDYFSGTALDLS